MKEITRDNSAEIKRELENSTTFIYGAGTLGRQTLKLLNEMQLDADYFVDDDPSKHGTLVEGKKCFGFDDLKRISKSEKTSVIMGSSFARVILERLKTIPVEIYEIYSMLVSDCDNALDRCLSMKQSSADWNAKWHEVKHIFGDEESRRIWQLMADVANGGELLKERFIAVSSTEEHYFVSPIPQLLNENSVLVDCGAYTGDMLGQLTRNNIRFGKIYEIEANPVVFPKIAENAAKLNLTDKVVPVNCGLSNAKGEMNFLVRDENLAASYLLDPAEVEKHRGGYKQSQFRPEH